MAAALPVLEGAIARHFEPILLVSERVIALLQRRRLPARRSSCGTGRRSTSAMLHPEQRAHEFGDRAGSIHAIEHDQIGRIADGDSVVRKFMSFAGKHRHHVETRCQFRRAADLGDIGVKVRHPDQRAIAERRERIEHVVARDRANDTIIEQPMRRGHAARNVVIMIAPHEKKIGRRQHGHRYASISEAFGNCGEPLGPDRRQFGDVTHSHTPAPAEASCSRQTSSRSIRDGSSRNRDENRCRGRIAAPSRRCARSARCGSLSV